MEKDEMFKPLEILDKRVKVVFQKVDGTLKEYEGVLVEGNKYSYEYIIEYCAGLDNKTLIPFLTNQGWKSFYKDKVISVTPTVEITENK